MCLDDKWVRVIGRVNGEWKGDTMGPRVIKGMGNGWVMEGKKWILDRFWDYGN